MTIRTNLLGLGRTSLEHFFSSLGEKSFRAAQVIKWIHQRGVSDFDQMTDISKALRDKLKSTCVIEAPEIFSEHISQDGTRKWLLSVSGGSLIETVYIPEKNRSTLCISSQVGCALNCSFCSTARQGFQRDLSVAEIIGQLWCAQDRVDKKITNVVMMGMGEPLVNFDAVSEALLIMRDESGYNLPRRRVTVSTSGMVPAIDKLSQLNDVSLAVSLHAPTDELRNTLVTLNKKYPISELMAACKRYVSKNKRYSVTMEYVMLAGVNDTEACARKLVKVLHGVKCKVNLIPFNPFPGTLYKCSPVHTITQFAKVLSLAGMVVTTRKTRGDDIDAACGQLVGKVLDRTRRSLKYKS